MKCLDKVATMHIILKNKLFIIFIFALVLRIYNLGVFPYGFHVDEVKAGWNAFSILKTGFDDHHNLLPLYYDSFGDFRPTGIFYSIIPFVLIFGKSIFAVRFSASLFGALSVFPIYFLTRKITKDEKVSLLSSFLLTISPWHFEVSRATSEVVISTFFALFSFYFLIQLLETKKVKYFYLNLISIFIAYLFYHSIRLLAPIIFIAIIFYYKKINKFVLMSTTVVILLTIFFTFSNLGLKRLNQVSIFKDTDINYEVQKSGSDKTYIYSKHLVLNYLNYFGTDFLVGNTARPYRYVTPGFGLMNFVEYILFIIGVIGIVRKKFSCLPLILLLLSPIPAVMTAEDIPNLHRAFLMMPFIPIISAFGVIYLKKYKTLILLALIINFLYFVNIYFHTYSQKPYIKDYFVDSPTYRNIGTTELAKKIPELQGVYEKVVITNFPDNPYPWYAFFNNIDPKIFNQTYSANTNQRIYKNVIFSENKCPADNGLITYNHQNVLFIEPWECPYEAQINSGYPLKITDKIVRPDGSLVYIFLTRDTSKPLIVDGKEIK